MNDLSHGHSAFSEHVAMLLTRVEYRRAMTEGEREAIYRLRYDANLRERAIDPNDTERLADRFDDVANVANFGVFIDGELTSALRLHVLSARRPFSPALDAYPDLLGPSLEAGKTIIDGNRFVADYPRARAFPHLPYVTLRLGIMAADYYGAGLITASVRAEHVPFYRREYRAAKMCEPRPYPTLVKPLSLIVIDYANEGGAICARHPFYRSTAQERAALFAGVLETAPIAALD